MSLVKKVNINTILGTLSRELSTLRNNTDGIVDQLQAVNDLDADEQLIMYKTLLGDLINQVIGFERYWTKYCSLFDEAVSKDIEMQDRIYNDNKELRAKYSEIVKNYNEILKVVANGLYDNTVRINKTLEVIEDDSAHIKFKRAVKEKGETHPNYRSDIETKDLVNDYLNNGRHLSDDIVEKYGLTYQAIRNRLLDAGVWAGRGN